VYKWCPRLMDHKSANCYEQTDVTSSDVIPVFQYEDYIRPRNNAEWSDRSAVLTQGRGRHYDHQGEQGPITLQSTNWPHTGDMAPVSLSPCFTDRHTHSSNDLDQTSYWQFYPKVIGQIRFWIWALPVSCLISTVSTATQGRNWEFVDLYLQSWIGA
jgi:hypothetical protein